MPYKGGENPQFIKEQCCCFGINHSSRVGGFIVHKILSFLASQLGLYGGGITAYGRSSPAVRVPVGYNILFDIGRYAAID